MAVRPSLNKTKSIRTADCSAIIDNVYFLVLCIPMNHQLQRCDSYLIVFCNLVVNNAAIADYDHDHNLL